MQETPVINTKVSEAQVDINDILGFGAGPGADSIITPDAKPSMFSRGKVDSTFLDEEPEVKPPVVAPVVTETKTPTTVVADKKETTLPTDTLDNILDSVDGETDETKKAGGRPKVDKSGLVETFSKLIEAGKLVGFDDDKALDTYTPKDFEELLEANFLDRDTRTGEKIQKEFFESLPRELQYAAKYHADGGTDIKGLFQALAHVEQVRDLKVDDPNDQEMIARNYLRATQFGNEDEIEEEVKTWKDLNTLDKKAKQFKPKLDKMQEQQVAMQLQNQEKIRIQNEAATKSYVENVYKALEPADLNGMKIDKKQQAFLYNALVNPQYPSISGRPTNLLGHLLEKYQYVEPNHALIAEALYLLSDPKGYRENVSKIAVNTSTEETVRRLKTEQANKTTTTLENDKENETRTRKIARPAGNFFKR